MRSFDIAYTVIIALWLWLRIQETAANDHTQNETCLGEEELRAEWEAELNQMRERVITLRIELANALRARSNAQDFDFVADHSGMFSLLGFSREQVDQLKAKNAIYMIDDSRINIAGIPQERIGELADALLAVISE